MITTEQMHAQMRKVLADQYGISLEKAERMRQALSPVITVKAAEKWLKENSGDHLDKVRKEKAV